MKRLSFLSMLLAVALVGNAQKSVVLRVNLPKDTVFVQNMEANMNIKMEFMGTKINTDVPFFTKNSYKVLDIQNGNFILECVFDQIKIGMDILGKKISYDSSEKNQDLDKNPLNKMLAEFINKPFSMTLDSRNNVISVEGLDRIFASVFDNGEYSDAQKAQMSKMINGIINEEKFTENYIIYPQEPVSKGFRWTTQTSQNFQGVDMMVKNLYKVEKITANTAEISAVSKYFVKGSFIKDEEKNIDAKLKNTKAISSYVIDLQTGLILSGQSEVDMTMIMTTKQEKSELKVPIQMTMKIVIK